MSGSRGPMTGGVAAGRQPGSGALEERVGPRVQAGVQPEHPGGEARVLERRGAQHGGAVEAHEAPGARRHAEQRHRRRERRHVEPAAAQARGAEREEERGDLREREGEREEAEVEPGVEAGQHPQVRGVGPRRERRREEAEGQGPAPPLRPGAVDPAGRAEGELHRGAQEDEREHADEDGPQVAAGDALGAGPAEDLRAHRGHPRRAEERDEATDPGRGAARRRRAGQAAGAGVDGEAERALTEAEHDRGREQRQRDERPEPQPLGPGLERQRRPDRTIGAVEQAEAHPGQEAQAQTDAEAAARHDGAQLSEGCVRLQTRRRP